MKNYKKVKNIIVVIILLFGFITVFFVVKDYSSEKNIKEYKEVNKIDSKKFKIFLEQEDGSYLESKNGWPSEGYIFNEEKTSCVDIDGNEIGNILEYKNGTINLTTKKTVFCNVYFEKSRIVRIEALVLDEYKKVTLESELKNEMFKVTAFYNDGSSNVLNNDDFIINKTIAPNVVGKFEIAISLNPNKFKEIVDEATVYMEVIKIVKLEAKVKNDYQNMKPTAVINKSMFDVKAVYSDDSKVTLSNSDFIIDKTSAPTTDGNFSVKITLNSSKFVEFVSTNVIMNVIYPTLITGSDFNAKIPSNAKKVVFSDETAPSNVTLIDVSEKKDKSIIAWLDGTTFKISSQIRGTKVLANQDSSSMFADKSNLEYIDFSSFDTKNVINMSYMFDYTGGEVTTFKVIGLNNWNTSKVEDMSWMFADAGEAATTFDIGTLSTWDTSNVKNMYRMFGYTAYYNATTFKLDLSKWDTSNVTNMKWMFAYSATQGASTWSIGDISDWNTSKVTDMSWMFVDAGMRATTFNIGNLSNWNTSKVTDMFVMFSGAGKYSKTFYIGDLSKWNTSNVTDFSGMFEDAGYSSATFNIGNLSNWNTGKATDMSHMFRNAGKNANWYLDCSKWSVSKVTEYDRFNEYVETKVKEPKWVN